MQQFKTVYFADHPASSTHSKNLKIAFGATDQTLYKRVASLSSEELRQAMGTSSFLEIQERARAAGRTINAYCIDRLRSVHDEEQSGQGVLPAVSPPPLFNIDPIQTTFKGGIAEPLHDWYPYLEGYSPDFVNTVLDTFAPKARRVLDPFGGTGTTPLAVAKRGGLGFYCELNPLLQFLIETKAGTVLQTARQREALVATVEALAELVAHDVPLHEPDGRLFSAYGATFGGSEFFPAHTLDTVLKLRTWLDTVSCGEPEAGAIATVATCAALLSSSNLIRRGDVRFRKGVNEIAARNDDLLSDVAARLRAMASSIKTLHTVAEHPLLIAGDAKRLERLAALDLDAAVTSPPYLNGTNYYRNTKVELWFLRSLHTQADLSSFRAQTVTAGINDVTVEKLAAPVNDTVAALVCTLNGDSYDRRIPQMVGSYFADMNKVIAGLEPHMKANAPLLMDIGDSAYARVHVDTPGILLEMLRERGWRNSREIVLRKRLSRSGQALRQVLIVTDAPAPSLKPVELPTWKRQWTKFKKTLPHQGGEYGKRNWGNPLHSLCSYQGKMKPSLAKHLVEAFTRPGDTMLDPFGGVGTIPFEAAMAGVKAWGFDISPAAVPIAMAKLQPASAAECAVVLRDLDRHIRITSVTKAERAAVADIRFNGLLADYFHPNTFDEILKARAYFHAAPPTTSATALVFASLLHVLHGNRPYALSRRSHPITPFAPTGEAEYKSLIEKVEGKVDRALAVERSPMFVPGASLYQDATAPWPIEVDNIDAIITSPPFFDSTRFYLANWMRLWFAGWLSEDFKKRPLAFVDERQKQGFSVYQPIIRQARERLKLGGVCVLHLGKSRKCDMAAEIQRIAKPWFARSEIFSENVEHCESHGIRDKGTVVEHLYLVLY
ncbi:MAG: DNA methyltransferase [Pseudorhodoferax sp.]